MPMPRVRFTVRRLMVAVAVVALALGVPSALHRRAERFHALADYHALWANRPGEWAWTQIARAGAVSPSEPTRVGRHGTPRCAASMTTPPATPGSPSPPDPPEPE